MDFNTLPPSIKLNEDGHPLPLPEANSGLPLNTTQKPLSIFDQYRGPFSVPNSIPVVSEQYSTFLGTGVTICLLKTLDGSYVTGESFGVFTEAAAQAAAKANALHKLMLISQFVNQRSQNRF